MINRRDVSLAVALAFAAAASPAQEPQECRVLVAKEWIAMGATSLSGCFRFADEAATPGERQFAKSGDTFLKVQGKDHFRSADGGNTWEPVTTTAPAGGFSSLNVLQPPDNEITQIA